MRLPRPATLVAPLVDLLYPPACWACGRPIPDQAQGLCAACPLIPLGDCCRRCGEPQGPHACPEGCDTCRGRSLFFRHVAALGRYEGALQALVRRAKFGGEPAAWGWLGARLAGEVSAAPWAAGADAVVAVPSSRRARWRRGYNPAGLLARPVARRLARPLTSWLVRQGPAVPQVGLGRKERLANVDGAFALARCARPEGLRLLLVDDVMTTGATLADCAGLLVRAGARSVDVAVAGR